MREERCRQLCLSFFQSFTNAFEVKGENVMRARFVFVDIQYSDLDPDSIVISVPLVTLWMIIYGSLGLSLFCLWGRGTS